MTRARGCILQTGSRASSVQSTPRIGGVREGRGADDTRDSRELAREARMALASIGIERPPSTRSAGSTSVSRPSSSLRPIDTGRGYMHPHNGNGSRECTPSKLNYSPTSPSRQGLSPNSIAERRHGHGHGALYFSHSHGMGHRDDRPKSPDDPHWDAELDELLQWTDALATVPEI
jgi:hypothetical protein